MVRYFVVRAGSWLLGRDVLIAPRAVLRVSEADERLQVDLSREQVEGCPPAYTAKPASRHYETIYHRYYGWEPYWTDPGRVMATTRHPRRDVSAGTHDHSAAPEIEPTVAGALERGLKTGAPRGGASAACA